MPRFAANLSTLFTDVPLPARFERAARAGFAAVELQFPYAQSAQALRERLVANRLTLVLHNLPPGDMAAGERGIACLPGREAAFRASLEQGLDYARTLGVPMLHCMAGNAPAGVADALLHSTFVGNLRHAAPLCKAAGVRLLIEPLNRFDMPGYWLDSIDKAVAVIGEVGSDNVFLQFDVYHAQRAGGELAGRLRQHLPHVAHIQIADNPGRHEPGSGEINFPFLFDHIDRIGYRGWIGAEYVPAAGTEAGLSWLAAAAKGGR